MTPPATSIALPAPPFGRMCGRASESRHTCHMADSASETRARVQREHAGVHCWRNAGAAYVLLGDDETGITAEVVLAATKDVGAGLEIGIEVARKAAEDVGHLSERVAAALGKDRE